VAALGAFVFVVGVLEVGLSAGIVAVVVGVLVSGVLLVPLDAELTGFGVVFVALKLGVPRKSKETKPPTTSKIRVIIKVSTQFRRHHPIGFMALLYPYIHVKVRLTVTSRFDLISSVEVSVEAMAKSRFLK
jgi:hypothetical protein